MARPRPLARTHGRPRLRRVVPCLLVAWVVAGCAAMLAPKKSLQVDEAFHVPEICLADMRVERNVLDCGRDLMAVARDFGSAAHARLETVLEAELAPAGKTERAREVKATIERQCLKTMPRMIALYDRGERRQALDEGLGPLARCVLYAGKVMENFGAERATKALGWAVQRLRYGVFVDEPFFGPPPDYDMGPIDPGTELPPPGAGSA